MTERLYLQDSGLLAFDAIVAGSRGLGGRTAVVLDRTAFYPEGGGQPADRGTLSGLPVVDVREVDGEILHVLGEGTVSGAVRGVVDAPRRRDHVQQHHGQHLLSATFESRAGARTVSFHLGEEICTIDLDLPAAALDAGVLRAVEDAANALVLADLPVEARELAPEELARLSLRKAPAKGTRVVVVGDLAGEVADASPCGGTHPRRTGEVGAIAVLRAVRWGEGARVEFVCGARVLRALAAANERLSAAASVLRCAPADVPAAAARIAEEGLARRKEADRLALALAAAEAGRLDAATPGPGPVVAAIDAPAPGAPAHLKAVAAALATRGRVALLGAVEDGRGHLAFARPKGAGPHLGGAVREAAARLGGKGGGAPDAAQGSGPDAAALEAALAGAAAAIAATSG